ncbi:MAG: ice-binding family protein [bacterium]|nr:ice-binding family protein [bacterium]
MAVFSLALGLAGVTTLFAAVPATSVDLLSAGNFVILSKTGITDVPTSAITGNIGTSPITGAAITGLDCVEVTGMIYTVDATGPACRTTDATLLTQAVSDMEAVYLDVAGRPAGVGSFLNVGAGTVTGQTLLPGTYTWDSAVTIPTDLMLDAQGDANAVWIFQIAGTLDMAAGKRMLLSGGAQTKNIFWQVAGAVTLGAGSHFEGNLLAKTNVAMITGATLNGRALAQTAVTLQSNAISLPSK